MQQCSLTSLVLLSAYHKGGFCSFPFFSLSFPFHFPINCIAHCLFRTITSSFPIIIIIIIIITIIIISFMQGIYTYIPETNYVPKEYSVAAILLLLFMVLISLVSVLNLLYFYISTFRSMCAVSNMAFSVVP